MSAPARARPWVLAASASTALAATLHDPGAHSLAGLERLADPLRAVFGGGFAVHATKTTSPDVLRFLTGELGGGVATDVPDGRVGKHRRAAVAMALALEPAAATILHSDLDHVSRWIEHDRSELESILSTIDDFDVLVVGRSPAAFAASPRRLRDTEAIVNHAFGLVSGCDGWDVMFAVRGMSRVGATAIVEGCREDTIGNDVEWPLFARRAGLRVGYVGVDGLSYRVIQDFGAAEDLRDGDASAWVRRVEIAAEQAKAMRPFLRDG